MTDVEPTTAHAPTPVASGSVQEWTDRYTHAVMDTFGPPQRVLVRGEGAYVWDADGNCFVDLIGSWGALLFGHARAEIVEAAVAAAARGTSFGAPTELETRLAQRVAMLMPSMERIRFVSSGTEATMSAIRVARAATRCDRIIKFEGCYHGHADSFLVQAGSGAMTLGIPTSPGVPSGAARDTGRSGRHASGRITNLGPS